MSQFAKEVAFILVETEDGKFSGQTFTEQLDKVQASFDECWKMDERGKRGRAIFFRVRFDEQGNILEHEVKSKLLGASQRHKSLSIRLGEGEIDIEKKL